MPDDPKIISSDNAQSKSDPVSNSPWDDDLPKEEAKQPMIVGGLEKKNQPAEQGKPVPFNIPKDVIEQKDNEKIPAIAVVKTPPIPPAENNSGVVELISPNSSVASPPQVSTPVSSPQIIHQPIAGDIQRNVPTPNAGTAAQVSEAPRAFASTSNAETKTSKPGLLSFFSKFNKGQASQSPAPTKERSSSPILKKLMLTFGILIILVAGIFLTENGIISIGFENIYGAVGVESIWGGLSKNPEKALAISLSKASSNLNFKGSGTISISASKSSDSKIIGPLLSFTSLNIAMNDQAVVPRAKAFLSAVDLYDTEDTNSYDVYEESDTTYDDISASQNSGSDVSTVDDTSVSPDSSDILDTTADVPSSSDAQDALDSYTPEMTVIKEINSEFKMESTNSGFKADLTVKKIIGTEDNINLILSGSDLFLKTNEKIKYSSKYKINKWLGFKMSSSPSGNILSKTPSVDPSSGFSIIGDRVSNEKVGNIRCYRYYLSKIEIGDALSSFGVSKDSVQSVSGDIWIGVKDKFIHKADITIIPASSSGVTKIHVVLNFSDYGVTNSLVLPTASDIVKVDTSDIDVANSDGDGDDNDNDAEGEEVSQVPGTTPVILDTEVARDTQRRSDLDKIKSALDSFKLANGRYPISSQIDKSISGASILKSSLVPTYLSAIPSDPKSAEGWFYGYQSADGVKFTLSARIENPSDTRSTIVNGIRLYWLRN